MQTVYLSAGYTMGPHYFAGSIGWLNAELNGSAEGYPQDDGAAFLGALVYYYSLSKRTQLYAFTSFMDGKQLLDAGTDFNHPSDARLHTRQELPSRRQEAAPCHIQEHPAY